MKNEIALIAILAVLATNAAFAHTFNAGTTKGNCRPDDIPSNVTENTASNPVRYIASWANKTYAITFDKNNDDATGEKTANCKYFDSNETPSGDADKCLALQSVSPFAVAGKIITGWNTKAIPDSNSTAIPLTAQYLQNLDNNALSDPNNKMTLYAQWTDCTVQYSDNAAVNSTNNAAKHIQSVEAQATSDNTCSYLVTCADGFNIGDANATKTKTFTGATSVSITADICNHGNEINLNWNKNTGASDDNMTIDSGEYKNNTCTYGASTTDAGHIVVPQPTRPGYTFEGWDIDTTNNG